MIREACAYLARNAQPQWLHINLSGIEFFRNPAQRIDAIVRESGVSPSRICFEVTETAAAVHQEVLGEFMLEMIALGYRFALDDFGTGYANLTQVVNLPFCMAKLDRILLAEDEKTRLVFDGIIAMFSRIGIYTVVEGVETPMQAHRVSQQASFIQGFLYARPMAEPQFIQFLETRASFCPVRQDEAF